MRALVAVFALSLGVAGCGSDDDGGSSGKGGGGAGGKSGSGGGGSGGSATGGNGGTSSGGTSSGGTSSGGSAAGGSGGASGSGGTPGACGAITTFADGLTPQKELHVSPSGNDSNDGAAATPMKTIAAAAKKATPGTAVRVHAGTYAGGGYIDAIAGSASAPIWIGGAPGEAKPVIDGGGEALHFTKVRYVVLHDLEVKNATQNGINVDDGGEYANGDATRYLVFQKLDIHDIGSSGNEDCLKLSGINDYWVLDSTFARCGGGMAGSGIDHVGCHRGLIARSTFTQMAGNAVQAKGGSEDIEIRACRVDDGGERAFNMGGSTGVTFFRPPLSTTAPSFEAKNIRAIANVIVGSTAALAFVGCVDCLAAHNTIIDPENWIFRILQETVSGGGYTFLPAQNGRFFNNLVYFSRADLSTYVNVGANTNPASFQVATNLWYAHDNPAQSTPTDLPSAETGAVTGQDPALANPNGGDFHIAASSPAAGKATPLGEVKSDSGGNCYKSPPSIGAFETP